MNGDVVTSDNENDQSVTAVIHLGSFDEVMAGDLSGFNTSRYKDIETSVASKVGRVEVYKVNHHGNNHSSNPTWLRTIRPRIAVISVGDGNAYWHPTPADMRRLHAARIAKTYWTERGAGARPKRTRDVVANSSIIVQVTPGSRTFTVTYNDNLEDSYRTWP